MDQIKELKRKSAEKAVQYINSGMVIGLGSGSTTEFAIQKIAELINQGKLQKIMAIPSSNRTEKIARKYKIPLTDFQVHQHIDLTIDGADEVDPHLNLIKGGGGALLREKVLIQSSKKVIIIVDESKLSPALGNKWAVPVEVLPFAWPVAADYLRSLGAEVSIRQTPAGKEYITDQQNFILDANFGIIFQAEELALKMSQRAGILEHGLFLELATDVIVAGQKGINHLKRFDVL
ncbi:MAG: ribose-5-phosphate isomerase RpiA [Calditrichaeota bacterium]|nr:ribose-5-phosphate isomerase RpiA [Calditrichota bacterium]